MTLRAAFAHSLASVVALAHQSNSIARKRTMKKKVFAGFIGAALLSSSLGCSNSNVRASTGPRPAKVEVAPVIQKDVPVQGEWIGTLEGYVNAQISPQVNGYL